MEGILYVATYPSARGRRGGSRVRLPRKEGARSRHQYLFEENIEKTGTCGLRNLIVKGSGVIFTHGEGISTPRVCHKGRQPSIKCANMISKLSIFHFLCFYVFFPFVCFFFFMGLLYILSFCDRQGCFPCSYVSSIVMRKSELRSSFRTKRLLSCFYLFSQDRF